MTYQGDDRLRMMDNTVDGSQSGDRPVVDGPRRLLAIDDITDSAELIARIAERAGFETRHTCDPTTVADVVREWRPDVVVTDVSMPGMDAIELVRVLSEAEFGGRLMFVSGLERWLLDQAGKIASSFGLNVVAKLQKPIDVSQLRKFLRETATAA